MAAALADSIPMLVISSDVPAYWSARPSRQFSHFVPSADGQSIAAAVSKRSILVERVADIDAAVDEACALARGGRPGPVHLNLPIDVLAAPDEAASAAAAASAASAAPLRQSGTVHVVCFVSEL